MNVVEVAHDDGVEDDEDQQQRDVAHKLVDPRAQHKDMEYDE